MTATGATGPMGATDFTRTASATGATSATNATGPRQRQRAIAGAAQSRGTLLVIAKAPVPGRVKTRLCPAYSPEEAARLAEAALRDTLDVALATPVRRRVLVLDGDPGDWLPEGFEVVPQCSGGLDARLAHAFGQCEGPTLLVGMDTPQVTVELLRAGMELGDGEASFGPAADGGFWALGMAEPDSALLRGVPMSVPETGAVQRQRLVRAGLTVRELPVLRDVDTAADARLVAAGAPGTRFAAALAALAGTRSR
ncbi:DUF2064 domain-containing protein [Streptomyces sp. NPDC002870]|uniref:TIGR04282 family arsenosugar biosynthesis glycosyltransferase n=1 Tax=Streptomyces sp. NPDC002870 TaxID=3364666 RepID=UPI0036779FAA